ncbi:MAG: hypothetical protein WAM85_24700 [Terracidiphilus sp.]
MNPDGALDVKGQLRALEMERRELEHPVCYLLKKNEDLRRQMKRGDLEIGFG